MPRAGSRAGERAGGRAGRPLAGRPGGLSVAAAELRRWGEVTLVVRIWGSSATGGRCGGSHALCHPLLCQVA